MYKYIIVDDESIIIKGTIKKLESMSDSIKCVGEALHGIQALQLIEEQNPDIIITDMNMPEMDGVKFLQVLNKKYPEKNIIVISGYKDFEYTKHAIQSNVVDYLVKPFGKQQIIQSVKRAIKRIQLNTSMQKQIQISEREKDIARYKCDMQLLKNNIFGYYHSEISVTSNRLKRIINNHKFIIVTMHTKEMINETNMQDFLNENGFGDLALYLSHIHNDHIGFLILFIPNQSALSIKELCTQVANYIYEMFLTNHIKITFGVSSCHDSLEEMHQAFLETVTSLNMIDVKNEGNIFYYASSQLEQNPIEWEKLDELLFRIEAGMTEDVMKLVKDLFIYFTQIHQCTLYDAKCYCFFITEKVKSMLSVYMDQIKNNDVNSSMQNILNSMFSLEEMEEYYIQLYTNISKVMEESSVYATDDNIEKIKAYIQRNYKRGITIEYIASLFYLNRSYCSHLFKQKEGVTFVNYLNQKRIDKAKELLIQTDRKMYQIAKSVGYDNVKYFFRIFKKYEKLTPEQYRLKYQEINF